MSKGQPGVPLGKLSHVVSEAQKFFFMLGEDVHIDQSKGQWRGVDFQSGSLQFTAEYVGEFDEPLVTEFNNAFDEVAQGKLNGRTRLTTCYQFAKIAEHLDPNEVVEMGIFRGEEATPEWKQVSKDIAKKIYSERQTIVESQGSIQGVIHSLFLRSSPPYFNARELSSENLIRCIYPPELYKKVASILQERDAVIHVHGIIKTNLVERTIENLRVEKLQAAPQFTHEDFEKFFGCSPKIIGEQSIEDYIERVRSREQ
jgi:hypothetical protein